MNNLNFCHLHCHDEYSYLDGFGHPETWVKKAKELDHTYLAITNHGNIDGCIKFQQACEKEGIIPVIGCELYIVEDLKVKGLKDPKTEKTIKEKRKHLTVLVKNQTGWENLCKMLSIANIDGFYYKPRVDANTVLSHSSGLVFLTACSASFLNTTYGMDFFKSLYQKHPNDVYFEIMPNLMTEQLELNQKIKNLRKTYPIGLVATNDCHYPSANDNVTQEVLLAIQTKAKWTDEKRWKFDIQDLYLKSDEQMADDFLEQGIFSERQIYSALKNTGIIAKKCSHFRIEKQEVNLPKVPGYENVDETALLTRLTKQGFRKKIETPTKEYRERIKEELGLICKKGFQRYFLIVWELINWCKKNDILTGPRGSCGGSLVAHLLGITVVDPIKYGLLFARFISEERVDLPDIDMDFEDRKRGEVRKHLEELYGEGNVCGISTFGKMKGRGSLKDVARVFDVPYIEADKAAKCIEAKPEGDSRLNYSIIDSFEKFEEGISFQKKYPNVVNLAIKLEGQIKSVGQHAAGICISNTLLKDGTRGNLCLRKGTLVINWSKENNEYVGLMKLDVLGLSALSVIGETLKMIKENYPERKKIELDNIPLDDNIVYEEISQGHCDGAFQIGSPGLSKFCKELGVHHFDEIVHATSLWRPGALRSGGASDFILRKDGKVKWDFLHPILEELTKDTYGIILYQEQVMLLMNRLAGLSWKVCDTIRKVISKSQGDKIFMSFEQKFVDGCKKEGTLNEEVARDFFTELKNFGSYAFNKSHAVGYSMITYWDMWLKTHYPTEFMACSLTYGGKDKKEIYINEARRLGLNIKLPKIAYSHPTSWLTDEDKNLFTPFLEMKGIGPKTAEAIVHMKDINIKTKGISEAVVEKLKEIGADDINRKFQDDEEEKLSQYFDFDISISKLGDLKDFYKRIEEKITPINRMDLKETTGKYRYYFGRMKNLDFSEKEETNEKFMHGFFEDVNGSSDLLVFKLNPDEEEKKVVEKYSEKWLLVKELTESNSPHLYAISIATEDDIRDGNLQGFDLGFIQRVKRTRQIGLKTCNKCSVNKSKTAGSIPWYNMAIVQETASFNSYGRRDNGLLTKQLQKFNLSLDMFLNTYVVKCGLSKKEINKKIITTCSQWLKNELEDYNIICALAFGNVGLQYFKGVDKGITGMSGKIEWNRKHKMWVCYCISPASANYEESNMVLFKKSIENYCNFINNGLLFNKKMEEIK